jgi:GNAT superfamily N-acetyltransferase
MSDFYFKETTFFEVLKTFRDYQTEIIQLLDKNNKFYLMCFEPHVFIVYYKNKPIGFINIDIARCQNFNNFVDIWLHPDYRGKGLGYLSFKKFEEEILPALFKKVKTKKYCLSATIDKTNMSSIRLFQKLGFVRSKNEDKLRNYGVLKPNEVRLIKCYQFS